MITKQILYFFHYQDINHNVVIVILPMIVCFQALQALRAGLEPSKQKVFDELYHHIEESHIRDIRALREAEKVRKTETKVTYMKSFDMIS